ncbi:hypothetical protein FRZ67_07345 [Panacibacter ginsenosidivorans]|uniref:Lipoprotein n=1 Tax=Panacibacter ginsenosidivorans TaxID=1813871 RepID=A0A5B8V880_9BACT|nr:hypothetical protein [Panacibacter ginsenosidivorans]QEC67113.1 hypothetical protein FRZ67_07345 [Panacibacter ginsenosidivorans]
MKSFILLGIAVVLLLSGCAAYKASRTPDDVYYSPAKTAVDRVDEDRYEDYSSNSDDNYLRMKVRNRYQWNGIDDYSYWNDSRYDFGYSCFPSREVMINPYYGVSVWNPYYLRPWGAWYNPVYTVVYYKTPKAYYGNTSKSNLSAYRNTNYYNPNRQSFGSLLKSAFSTNNYNNSNNNFNSTNPTRSFSTGTTPSGSAGGRSGGFNSSGSSSSSPRPPR